MFRKRMRKFVTDVKVIPGQEVAPQHQLLVCDMQMTKPPKTKRKFFLRLKVWKLNDPETCTSFKEVFEEYMLPPECEEVPQLRKSGLNSRQVY